MRNIPDSNRIARAWGLGRIAFALFLAAGFMLGCRGSELRDGPPDLVIDPPLALQGASMVLNLSAEDVDFSRCGELTPASLSFTSPAAETQIQVLALTLISGERVRAVVVVDADARVGQHRAKLSCDPATILEGELTVRSAVTEPALTFEPASGPAGIIALPVRVVAPGAHFAADVTHVVFGDGGSVRVRSIRVLSAEELALELDLASDAEEAPIAVAIITGSEVARGSFAIADRLLPSISVSPTLAERGTSTTLTITGAGVEFISSEGGLDDSDPLGSRVEFPDNPGIAVTGTSVISPTRITANIAIDELATLGLSELAVTTAGTRLGTGFVVLPQLDEPILTLQPGSLARGVTRALLLAEVTNLTLVPPVQAAFSQPGCSVDDLYVIPAIGGSRNVLIWVSVAPNFSAPGNTLTLATPLGSASAFLAVVEPSSPMLGTPVPAVWPQGAEAFAVTVPVVGGALTGYEGALVAPRSGVRISSSSLAEDGRSVELILDVAVDAPTGPVGFSVVADGIETVAYAEVGASTLVPSFSWSPAVFLPGPRTADFQILTSGLDLGSAIRGLEFDDPALRLVSFVPTGDDGATVTLEIGSGARAGVAATRLHAGGVEAAANLRGLSRTATRCEATPRSLERGSESTVELTIERVDGRWEGGASLVSEVRDGSGLEILGVSALDDTRASVHLRVDGTGAGGWTGVMIKSEGQRCVAPVWVEGDDESLSLISDPETVPPGSSAAPLTVTMPPGLLLSEALAESGGGSADVATRLVDVVDAESVSLVTDSSAIGLASGEPHLFWVGAGQGAAVGELEIPPLATQALAGTAPEAVDLTADEPRLLEITTVAETWVRLAEASEGALLTWLGGGGFVALSSGRELLLPSGGDHTILLSSPVSETVTVVATPAFITAVELVEPEPSAFGGEVDDPCTTPWLAHGLLAEAFDVDRVRLVTVSCDLEVAVLASRSTRARDAAAIASLTLLDDAGGWLDDAVGRLDADARLMVPMGTNGARVEITARLAAAGDYWFHVKRAATFDELCVGASGRIVIDLAPGFDPTGLTLELRSPTDGAAIASVSLGPDDGDGRLVIGAAVGEGVDLVAPELIGDPGAPWSLALIDVVDELDAVALGAESLGGEGAPWPAFPTGCVRRVLGVDTNNNDVDWLAAP